MKNKGAIDPVTLTVVAVLALAAAIAAPSGKPGKRHFWEFWKKDPVAETQKAQAQVDTAKAAIETDRQKELKVAQDAAVATSAAITAAQVTTAAGKLPVRELETAHTLARTNVQAMGQALGDAAPARVRELETMVRDLDAGIAAGAKALDVMQASHDQAVRDKVAAQAQLAAAETARDQAVKKEEVWALERDGIARQYERLTYWTKLGAVLVLFVVGYVAHLLLRVGKLGAFAKDAVGMTEMLKTELKSRASAADYASIKDRMRTDWMTVHDGTAALVEKLKSDLRL